MSTPLTSSTAADLVQRLSAGEVTSVEVTGAYLDRIAAEDGALGSYLHVDPEAAASTPFGGTIAHGFLSLSLLSRMAADVMLAPDTLKMGVNYGFDRVRFLAPVKSGKRVRGHFKLLELEQKRPGQWQETMETTIEIEGEEKPALIAEWISQFFV